MKGRRTKFRMPPFLGDGITRSRGTFNASFPIINPDTPLLYLTVEAIAQIRESHKGMPIWFDWQAPWFWERGDRLHVEVPFESPVRPEWLQRHWAERNKQSLNPYRFDQLEEQEDE